MGCSQGLPDARRDTKEAKRKACQAAPKDIGAWNNDEVGEPQRHNTRPSQEAQLVIVEAELLREVGKHRTHGQS